MAEEAPSLPPVLYVTWLTLPQEASQRAERNERPISTGEPGSYRVSPEWNGVSMEISAVPILTP